LSLETPECRGSAFSEPGRSTSQSEVCLSSQTSQRNMQDAKTAAAVKYFFGRISRDEAEDALRTAGIREGLFLLRESIIKAGDYVLSICHEGRYVMLDLLVFLSTIVRSHTISGVANVTRTSYTST